MGLQARGLRFFAWVQKGIQEFSKVGFRLRGFINSLVDPLNLVEILRLTACRV